jgi:hypothetical protein
VVAALSKEKASRAVLKEAVGFTDEELALVSSLFR